MITVPKVAQLLEVTHNTASKHIDRLIEAGILRSADERKRNRIFVADGIIQAVYDPEYGRAGKPLPKEQ
jgi:DNA-binding transcriptional ArsR family regulator